MEETNNDVINNLITYKICKQILEEPVSLPCQKHVCLNHVNEEKDSNSIYKCCFCNKGHQIDMRKLSANEEIKKLIEEKNKYINIDSVKFGENNILGRDQLSRPVIE